MANKTIKINFLNNLDQLETDPTQHGDICHKLKRDLSAFEGIPSSLERQILSLIIKLEIDCLYEEENCQSEIDETINKLKVEISKLCD